jgi:anti-sigma B factor antagonist
MDQFQIQSAVGPTGACILHVVGPLTLQNAFDFQSTARKESERPVIVDLTDVPYMDSAGLGAILGVFASCQRTQRGFAVAGASGRVRTLLQVAKADHIVPVFDTVEAAEARLSAKAQQA